MNLNLNGGNQLTLAGGSGNTYTGATTISNGTVILANTAGYAIPANCTISGGSTYVIVENANQQFSPNSIVTFSSTPHLEIYGNNVTVGGISAGSATGVIENTETETGVGSGTLTVNSPAGSSSTYSGYLRNTNSGSGTLTLVKSGAGSLTLSGSLVGQYTGGLTVNAGLLTYTGTMPNCNYWVTGGTLNIGSTSRTSSMKVLQLTGGLINGSGTLTGTSAYDLEAGTVSAYLGGSVGLTKTTAGSVTFTVTPPGGPYTISAGTLNLNALSKTMSSGSLTMSGGTLTGTGTLTAASGYNFNVQAGTVNMILGGTASTIGLLKTGTGTALLTAVNKYGGTTTINGGTLQLGSGSTNGAAGTGTITINSGGTLQLGDGNTGGSLSGAVTVNAGGVFDVNCSNALTLSSTTTCKVGGSGTWIKDGGGTLTVSGSQSFAGNLVVNNGLFSYGGNTGSFPSGNFTINGGTLDFGALSKTMGSAGVLTLAGGTLSGTGTLTGTSAYQLQAGTVNINLGGSVGVNKTGPGTATLLKNLPGGNYAISAGSLNLGSFSQSISGLSITGGTVTGNGTLTSGSDYNVQGGEVDIVLGGSTVGVHKSGPATAILTRANTFGGSTTISGGALQADFGSTIPASGFLTLDGGVLETLSGGTFTRGFGSGGSNSFEMTANGGGFSTAGGPCAVNIGGNGDTVPWGDDVGAGLVGTLETLLADLHQFGDLLEPDRSLRQRLHDRGRQQSELDGRLRGAGRRHRRFLRQRLAAENGRRHTLRARVGLEQLRRHDDDHGHGGVGQDRRRHRHPRRHSDPQRDGRRHQHDPATQRRQRDRSRHHAYLQHVAGQRPPGTERTRANRGRLKRQQPRGDRGAVRQHRLEYRQHADGEQRRQLHLCGGDSRQRAGQRHGQGEPDQERRRQPAAQRHGQLHWRDDHQRRHAASDRLDLLLLGREHRSGRHVVLQPHRRLSGLRQSDHRLGHGADLPRGAQFQRGHGGQHRAVRLRRHGEPVEWRGVSVQRQRAWAAAR